MFATLSLLSLLLALPLCVLATCARETRVRHDATQQRIAVHVHADTDVDALADALGLECVGPVGALAHHYVLQTTPEHRRRRRRSAVVDMDMGNVSEALRSHAHVHWFGEQRQRTLVKRSGYVVRDPEFANQWHLQAANAASLNVQRVWDAGVFGAGVVVCIVDDGLAFTHPDLSANFRADLSYDFNDDDPDVTPLPSIDDHGTSAAGACCAIHNMDASDAVAEEAFCGVGVAPRASTSAVRLVSRGTEDYQEVGVAYKADGGNDVFSNSWGPPDDGRRLEGPGPLASKAREQAMQNGRGGRGPIYVWAAGNGRQSGDNCNYDGWANHRYALTIGAVESDLKQPYYSENCASMFGVAPSNGRGFGGITTTDLLGTAGTSAGACTNRFGGTSAAAPLAAGIVALVLSIRPDLGWRDVQGVFALSSEPIDVADASWQTTGAGLHFSHKYGFGLINAESAVDLARNWVNYKGVQAISSGVRPMNALLVPGGTLEAKFECDAHAKRVLHVDLMMFVAHPRRGELEIRLRSPHGTVSELQDYHSDTHTDIGNWTYTSVANWHEPAAGTWTVTLANMPKAAGQWMLFEMILHTVDM
jgi:hypothetical protein